MKSTEARLEDAIVDSLTREGAALSWWTIGMGRLRAAMTRRWRWVPAGAGLYPKPPSLGVALWYIHRMIGAARGGV